MDVYGDIRLVNAWGTLNMAPTDPRGCIKVFNKEVGELLATLLHV